MATEMEDAQMEESENSRELEVAPALIAVHPSQKSLTVAVGSDLRVYDLHKDDSVSLTDDSDKPFHKDSIRAIRYGASGELFVSAGDDKLVKIWSTDSWHCIGTVSAEKRVSAIAVSNDNLHVCFADKFGVVWVLRLEEDRGKFNVVNKKAASLLSHYCSIITSLEFSPDGRFIVSADRDFKIRVTVFPKRPLDGAHEIQSFCLGHSEFVSCLDFIRSPDNPVGFLVSGSGDSTVRLWDITSGSLLSTYEVGSKARVLESNGKEVEKNCNGVGEDNFCAVTDLCAVPNGTLIAVAIQSYKGIVLLSCDLSGQSISFVKVVPVVGESFIPTSLATSSSECLLWMVTGISKLNGVNCSSMGRVRAMSGFKESNELEVMILEDEAIPGGKKLLEKLQGSVLIEESVYLAAAEALKAAMSNLLIKKQYTVDKRETRKRNRNDKKFKQ